MADLARRRFFGALLSGGAAAAAALPAQAITHRVGVVDPHALPILPGQLDAYIYLDYEIHFTGWKPDRDNPLFMGQWIAWPVRRTDPPADDEQPYLYVNVPGMIGGPFWPGACFNISSRDRFITRGTSDAERHAWLTEGKARIEQMVRAYRGLTATQANFAVVNVDNA